MPLRLLARAAPFLLGAVAAALWLQRRRPVRAALPAPAAPDPAPAPEPPRPRRQSTRFVRASERRPIDIVTVVDDLLGTASQR
jgi:hypothetical protein